MEALVAIHFAVVHDQHIGGRPMEFFGGISPFD